MKGVDASPKVSTRHDRCRRVTRGVDALQTTLTCYKQLKRMSILDLSNVSYLSKYSSDQNNLWLILKVLRYLEVWNAKQFQNITVYILILLAKNIISFPSRATPYQFPSVISCD